MQNFSELPIFSLRESQEQVDKDYSNKFLSQSNLKHLICIKTSFVCLVFDLFDQRPARGSGKHSGYALLWLRLQIKHDSTIVHFHSKVLISISILPSDGNALKIIEFLPPLHKINPFLECLHIDSV